jgi:hypothetical protein
LERGWRFGWQHFRFRDLTGDLPKGRPGVLRGARRRSNVPRPPLWTRRACFRHQPEGATVWSEIRAQPAFAPMLNAPRFVACGEGACWCAFTHTRRRMAREYLQEAETRRRQAPDIGLLKELGNSPTRGQVAAFARPAKSLKDIGHWIPEHLARNDPRSLEPRGWCLRHLLHVAVVGNLALGRIPVPATSSRRSRAGADSPPSGPSPLS